MNAKSINIKKEIKMSELKGIKNLVGQKMTKTVKFLNSDIKISKLTVAEVLEIQSKAANIEKDDTAGLELLKTVIRSAVEGGADLDDSEFDNFPMDELSKLSNEIMKYSGLGQSQDAGKSA
jgi:hypothetical protein